MNSCRFVPLCTTNRNLIAYEGRSLPIVCMLTRQVSSLLQWNRAHNFRRITCDDRPWRHIFGNYRSGAHDGALTYLYPLEYNRMCPHPAFVAKPDRLRNYMCPV